MVLLHTAMRFNGLAGVATLLTAVVVASGIVGRYLYTALPRTLQPDATPDTATTHAADSLAARRQALASWHAVHVPLTWALFAAASLHAAAALYFATLQR
jgi:cytochrome b561